MDWTGGRELRVKKTRVLGMWYQGIGYVAGLPFLLAVFEEWRPLFFRFAPFSYLAVVFLILVGIHSLAFALHWTFARVRVDEMGIALYTLSGERRLDWMNLHGLDFVDKSSLLVLTGRTGEQMELTTGVEDFNQLLNVILQKAASASLISHVENRYTNRRFNPRRMIPGAAGVLLFIGAVLAMDYWIVGVLMMLFVSVAWLIYLMTGLKWVEFDGITVKVKFAWHMKEMELADIQTVRMIVEQAGNRENARLLLRLEKAVKGNLDIPMRGPDLLPLYLRLKLAVDNR